MKFRRWAPVAWLRRVLPGQMLVPAFAIFLCWFMSWSPKAEVFGNMVKVMFCVWYGFYRGARFHPLHNVAYLRWLVISPWHAGRPLPKGPVQLVLQDAVVIAGVLVLGYGWMWPRILLGPIAFLFAYMLCHTWYLFATQLRFHLFVLLFSWPLVVIGQRTDWQWFAGIAAILYLVIWHGTRLSLRRYPWTDQKAKPPDTTAALLPEQLVTLTGKGNIPSISTLHGFLLSLVVGWWAGAFTQLFQPGAQLNLVGGMVLSIAAFGAAAGRWKRYSDYCSSPMSLPARLGSGRWIIAHDRIAVVPLAICIAAVLALTWISLHGISAMAVAIATFVITLKTLVPGPTLRSWCFTGPGNMNLGPKQLITNTPVEIKVAKARGHRVYFRPPFRFRSTHYGDRVFVGAATTFGVFLFLSLSLCMLASFTGWGLFVISATLVCVYLLIGFPLIYGLVRLRQFHPAWIPHYTDWLKQTPWTPAKPLPLGTYEVQLRDVALLGSFFLFELAAALWVVDKASTGELRYWPLNILYCSIGCAIAPYFLVGIRTLWMIGQKNDALLFTAIFGAEILLFPHFGWMLLLLVAAYPFLIWRLRAAWKSFPWESPRPCIGPSGDLREMLVHRSQPEALANCDWMLAGKPTLSLVPASRRIILIALAGWFTFCVLTVMSEDSREKSLFFLLIFLIVVASMRLGLYKTGKRSTGLFGRLASRRVIISEYDRILVAPFAILVSGILTPVLLNKTGVPLNLNLAFCVCLALTIAAFAGPSMQNFELTGGWQLKKARK